MRTADPHQLAILAVHLGGYSIEFYVIAVAVVIAILLLAVRARRSHDQKRRRAASSGFYDFDVARYGHAAAGSSLMETKIAQEGRPLAPSFVAPGRDANKKGKDRGVAPVPIPTSFAAADRSIIGPVPAFDQATAVEHRPPTGGESLPIPSSPNLPGPRPLPSPSPESDEAVEPPPPPAAGAGTSLPLLVQPPPPPDPRSD
jgi:hypothetical protein